MTKAANWKQRLFAIPREVDTTSSVKTESKATFREAFLETFNLEDVKMQDDEVQKSVKVLKSHACE